MAGYLFLNFKAYKEATGRKALELGLIAQKAAGKTGARIVLVAQAVDVRELSQKTGLEVFAQAADPVKPGAHTGAVSPYSLKDAGCAGVVLNHAENKRQDDFIMNAINESKSVGLKVMACAESVKRAAKLARFQPDFIAIEPPELIGGGISVSTARPELIIDSVKEIKKIGAKIKVITGAGVKSAIDARLALKYGCRGVFVASGIVLAKNQKKALEEIAGGLK